MFMFRFGQFGEAVRWIAPVAGVVVLAAISGSSAAGAGWPVLSVVGATAFSLVASAFILAAALGYYVTTKTGPQRALVGRLKPDVSFIGRVDAGAFRWMRREVTSWGLRANLALPCSIIATDEALEIYTLSQVFPAQLIYRCVWSDVVGLSVQPRAVGSGRLVLALSDVPRTVSLVVFNHILRPARRDAVERLAEVLRSHIAPTR